MFDSDPLITGSPMIGDNCPNSLITFADDLSGLTECSGTGEILRTWTVTDDCGNDATCVQSIIVEDVELPSITCPVDVTIDLDATCVYNSDPMITGNPTIADNCPGSTFAFVDDLSGLTECSGTCLLYTSPSPRDATLSRMPSSA